MRFYIVLSIALCVISVNLASAKDSETEQEQSSEDSTLEYDDEVDLKKPIYLEHLTSEETNEVTETCCVHGEAYAMLGKHDCDTTEPPESIEVSQTLVCLGVMKSCCQQHIKRQEECTEGMSFASAKRCGSPVTEIGKNCCEECSLGTLSGESQGISGCGEPPADYMSPEAVLRKNAFYKCCREAAYNTPVTPEETVTEKPTCTPGACEHTCNIKERTCSCYNGYRLMGDNKSCKDINECAELNDNLCPLEGTVCHNTVGSYICVPIKKREVGLSCPPGFKANVKNQVCDDINECELVTPPCPRSICENTIGAYKCNGVPGTPITGDTFSSTPPSPIPRDVDTRNDICPPGFRAGPNDDCMDVNECTDRLDDCNRLSQHCINTHGSFFCQDHVSRRCKPGFSANVNTGICQDINECEENSEACARDETCVNMAGAYTCKKKTETYPTAYQPRPRPSLNKTVPKVGEKCRDGTRMKPGGGCEDIDECTEGGHLCDRFQDCVNTFGGHECQCKSGFELDASEACVDIDECALKLDDCPPNTYCLNALGSYICNTKKSTNVSANSTTTLKPPKPSPLPPYEYEYYYSDEDNSTMEIESKPQITSTTTTTLPPRTTPRRFGFRSTTRPYTNRPVTTSTTRKPEPLTPHTPLGVIPVDVAHTPKDPFVVEKEKDPDGSVAINTANVPKNTWTNIIGIDRTPDNRPDGSDRPNNRPDNRPRKPVYRPDRPDGRSERPNYRPDRPSGIPESKTEKPNEDNIDLNELLHCLNGYEKNAQGDCVDVNECETGRHICGAVEVCENRPGGYICDCKQGYKRNVSGAGCVKIEPAVTPSIRKTTTTTEAPRPSTDWSPYASRDDRERPGDRWHPPRAYGNCEMGYIFNSQQGACIDIDECTTNRAACSVSEDCVNTPGGYQCVCGSRCRANTPAFPTYVVPQRGRADNDQSIITVGSQFGQRGPHYLRPSTARLPNTGAIVKSCPWGYKLTADQMCYDIDECVKNVTECGPQQRCENFYGGYSCQCPSGHRLVGQNNCEDINECAYSRPCSYNSKCVNIPGSYRCECDSGFRNAPSNDKVCVDVDECAELPNVCEHGCANGWGGYRCICKKGYRLHTDNRTCVDVDECMEWQSVRLRGRLCGGECVNEPGSYRCSCPKGYRLSEDGRNCIDIDECEMGTASCARGPPGVVCQNTRGEYYCHRIDCPNGYRLESKHKCTRVQRSCPVGDWDCIQQPSSYSYNFITFVANVYLPHGSVDLFTMHGPAWKDCVVTFDLQLLKVNAQNSVTPMDLNCFDMRQMNNICVVSLRCSPEGPQVGELELSMSLHQRGQFAGSAVARLIVIVSQYEF